ncbi:MAG: cupredoxin domain-containing protein [Planctomycetes bacterium]|nr:cupredoxin domain-containing protein [Planctomycetota bacterium]
MNPPSSTNPMSSSDPRTIDVLVERGYHPRELDARPGERLRIAFSRREHGACSRDVVFPGLGIRRALPFGETVAIDLPELPPGDYAFTCGMSMLRGVLHVRAG